MKTHPADPIQALSSRVCTFPRSKASSRSCATGGKRPTCMLCIHCSKCAASPRTVTCDLCAACALCALPGQNE